MPFLDRVPPFLSLFARSPVSVSRGQTKSPQSSDFVRLCPNKPWFFRNYRYRLTASAAVFLPSKLFNYRLRQTASAAIFLPSISVIQLQTQTNCISSQSFSHPFQLFNYRLRLTASAASLSPIHLNYSTTDSD